MPLTCRPRNMHISSVFRLEVMFFNKKSAFDPKNTECDPVLPDLFIYLQETEFLHKLLKRRFTFRYINDDGSINIPKSCWLL